jgi:hypothetical protein
MHMQRQTYEFIEVSDGQFPPPITFKQNNRQLARLPGLVLMATLAGLIVAPQIGLAAYALASPEVRASLINHPWATVELAVALLFWVGLVCWPLRSMLMALICHRSVEIRDGEVRVIDETPFSTVAWRAPLTTYEGIALDVRSSLSGIRQEATLVHPNCSRSVVLMVAERIGDREIEELCHVFDLPRLPAGRMRGFGPPGTRNPVADLAAVAA